MGGLGAATTPSREQLKAGARALGLPAGKPLQQPRQTGGDRRTFPASAPRSSQIRPIRLMGVGTRYPWLWQLCPPLRSPGEGEGLGAEIAASQPPVALPLARALALRLHRPSPGRPGLLQEPVQLSGKPFLCRPETLVLPPGVPRHLSPAIDTDVVDRSPLVWHASPPSIPLPQTYCPLVERTYRRV